MISKRLSTGCIVGFVAVLALMGTFAPLGLKPFGGEERAAAAESYEPNDTFETAYALAPGTYNSAVTGNDWDYYSFSVPEGMYMDVAMSGMAVGTRFYLVLFDSGRNQVDYSDAPLNGDERLKTGPGDYYLLVHFSVLASGDYTLSLTLHDMALDAFEPNDTFESAAPLSPGSHAAGISWFGNSGRGDLDYYSFAVPAGKYMEVTVSGIPAGCDYNLYLYDGERDLFSSSEAPGNADESQTIGAGNCYALIKSAGGDSDTDPYALTLTLHDCVFVVTNTDDAGAGSLRQAIHDANTSADNNVITFQIPGGGPHVIALANVLPAINTPVTVDGYSQSGAAAASDGTPADLRVVLNGTGIGAGMSHYGLLFTPGSSGSVVRGLEVVSFGLGIAIREDGIAVRGNHLGTDAASAAGKGNLRGVSVEAGSGNVIGGSTAADRNVISGNLQYGIFLCDPAGDSIIQGNYIGTGADGAGALENGEDGVYLLNSDGNLIGGSAAGERNVISGNREGIRLHSSSSNRISGNYIGTDAGGTLDLGNLTGGVVCNNDSNGNLIGGSSAGERNVISGNGNNSQYFSVYGILIHTRSGGNIVRGNYIGTDAGGTARLGNDAGIRVRDESGGCLIGGSAAAEGNVVSGNGGHGIWLDWGSDGSVVYGNLIGTDAGGTAYLGNDGTGILVGAAVTIGGYGQGEGNVVSGNLSSGVEFISPAGNCDVTGNRIRDNLGTGVAVGGGSTSGIRISRNSIYGNGGLGIDLGNDGVTANDGYNNVEGQINRGRDCPEFTSDSFDFLEGAGRVTGKAPAGSLVEIFATGPAADVTGHGEGLTYLTSVIADSQGNFGADLAGLANGAYISAVDLSREGDVSGEGNTSEFSANALIRVLPIITATAGENGSIAPAGKVPVVPGEDQSFAITPHTGWHVDDVLVNGLSVGAVTSYEFTDVTYDQTISAGFAINTYAVNASVFFTGHGGVDRAHQSVDYAGTARIEFIPDPGYHVACIYDNGLFREASDHYEITNIAEDHNVIVVFEPNTYSVTTKADGSGTVSGAGTYEYGSTATLHAAPDKGWHFVRWSDAGGEVSTTAAYSFTVGAGGEYTALFAQDPTITAAAGPEGSISPAGTMSVAYGSSCSFFIDPDEGYHISDVSVDGIPQGAVAYYTFTDVTGDHVITAAFAVNTYEINASVFYGGHGDATPSNQTVNHGSAATIDFVPETGYHLAFILDNGAAVPLSDPYVLGGVCEDHDVIAFFAADSYVVETTPAGSGTTRGGGTYAYGTAITVSAVAAEGWHFTGWTEGGVDVSADAEYSFAVTGPRNLVAHFAVNTYEVSVQVMGGGGVASPAHQVVAHGGEAVIDLVPDAGFRIASITDNGIPVPVSTPYVIGEVAEAHGVIVVFSGETHKWYLPEGCTAGGIETWVLVANPGDTEAAVDLTLMTAEGPFTPGELRGIKIPASSRASFNLGAYITTYDVATMVSSGSAEVVCERAVYGNDRAWGTDSVGTRTPSDTWYLAEGCTDGGCDTYLMIQNPNPDPVRVDIALAASSGTARELKGYRIGAQSRATVHLNDYVTDYEIAATVISHGGEVICERAVYGADRAWGHDSIGATAPATAWYLAEGCTYGGMETWLLVQNPNDAGVTVDLTLMTAEGPLNPDALTDVFIPAHSRRNFNLGDHVTTYDVSTLVTSRGGGVVVERSMYGDSRNWGTCSLGTTAPATAWYLAEGCTGGDFETYVLVQNPGDGQVTVDLDFMTPHGLVPGPRRCPVPGNSRRTFKVNDYVTDFNVSTRVTASGEVVCERAMYGGDRTWAHDSVGYAP